MEKIIFRKFLYDLIGFFLIVSISLSLITWIIQSVNYLDFISKDGHGFSVYFSFISLNFPKIFSKVIIFSYFISVFFIIQKYQLNNEILIFWTNGISKIRVVNFIIKVSILFTIIQILLTYFLVPKLQDYSRDFIRSSNIDLFSSLITEKKFIDTVKDFTIFVADRNENGDFIGVIINDASDRKNMVTYSAKKAKLYSLYNQILLEMTDGKIFNANKDLLGEDMEIISFESSLANFIL